MSPSTCIQLTATHFAVGLTLAMAQTRAARNTTTPTASALAVEACSIQHGDMLEDLAWLRIAMAAPVLGLSLTLHG